MISLRSINSRAGGPRLDRRLSVDPCEQKRSQRIRGQYQPRPRLARGGEPIACEAAGNLGAMPFCDSNSIVQMYGAEVERVNEFATLAELFSAQAERLNDRVFLRDKVGKAWRDHSWNDIGDEAGRLRAGLLGLGLERGDRIAILSDNCPRWVVVDQAALGMGAVLVAIPGPATC